MNHHKCARCRRTYPEHVKSYVAPLRQFRPFHPDACDQFVAADTVSGKLTWLTARIDGLTTKVLAHTLGRKH